MFFKKDKQKLKVQQDWQKSKKYIDGFVYVFLTIFVLFCLYFRMNFILISIVAVIFSVFIFLVYLGKYKLRTSHFFNKDGIKDKIENLDLEEILELLSFYYKDRKYNVIFDKTKYYIEKNNHKYKIFIFLNTFSKENLHSICKAKGKFEGKILVTNTELSKENRKIVKENKIYTITKEGLINIYQDYIRNQRFIHESKGDEKADEDISN